MALTQRLDLRQTQSLVMTPQLQQAIRLLQLSHIELTAYVDQELERNPLLDRGEADAPAMSDAFADAPDMQAGDSVVDRLGSDRVGTDRLAENAPLAVGEGAPLDADFTNVWNDSGPGDDAIEPAFDGGAGQLSAWSSRGADGGSDDLPSWEDRASRPESLHDHLQAQCHLAFRPGADRLIGERLIDQVDNAGYLAITPAALAEELGCPVARVDRVLDVLRNFDPPGVFARDLADCLALQLADRDRLDPAMAALVAHLDLVAARNLPRLRELCGVDADDLTDMLAELRALNPKPGLVFDVQPAEVVVPDVLVRDDGRGGWLVDLNPDALPRVLVNQTYHAEVQAACARDRAAREYLADCLASANWLVKALHQRATTILKVATEIIRQQDGFLRHGIQHLRPLILRDIAEAIGMHESTVSRVTTAKYMATPRGLFELKYFFSAAIGRVDGGEAHSAESVRHRIKLLVDAEQADSVLSDDQIVEILRGQGVDIARRTVAKYRDALKIPSSVQRRRLKAEAAELAS